jgi:hypothetical protein
MKTRNDLKRKEIQDNDKKEMIQMIKKIKKLNNEKEIIRFQLIEMFKKVGIIDWRRKNYDWDEVKRNQTVFSDHHWRHEKCTEHPKDIAVHRLREKKIQHYEKQDIMRDHYYCPLCTRDFTKDILVSKEELIPKYNGISCKYEHCNCAPHTLTPCCFAGVEDKDYEKMM